jgi:hypothetical protein
MAIVYRLAAGIGQSFRRRRSDKLLGKMVIFPALSRGEHERRLRREFSGKQS